MADIERISSPPPIPSDLPRTQRTPERRSRRKDQEPSDRHRPADQGQEQDHGDGIHIDEYA